MSTILVVVNVHLAYRHECIFLNFDLFFAGSIIGKGGEAIKDLKSRTNAQIKVSGRDELFPYTDERIILLVAPAENAMEAVTFIHSK